MAELYLLGYHFSHVETHPERDTMQVAVKEFLLVQGAQRLTMTLQICKEVFSKRLRI